MGGIRSALIIAALFGAAACGAEPAAEAGKQSALGEGCVKSADCSGDLVCVGGACAKAGSTADIGAADGADAEGGPDAAGTDVAPQDITQADTDSVTENDDASTDTADGQVSGSDADAVTDAKVDTCDSTCPAGACVNLCGQPCGAVCTDNNACTIGDACKAGACAGQAVTCDDKNPCTSGTCDPTSGCKYTQNTATCDDDNPCTVADVCKSGVCEAGAAKACPSTDSCVLAKCSITGGGKCVFSDAPDGSTCDDGTACTAGDSCKTGTCAGQKLDCDDKNSCTTDVCDPKTGCVHHDLNAACDDSNDCTVSDTCKAGACEPGKAKNCDDNSPCTKDSCSTKTGQCVNAPEPFDGTTCDADGSKCTIADACNAGVCVPGKKANCDDGNICTADSCDVKAGCENAPTTGPCNADDSVCTVDLCTSAKCVAGQGKACIDNNACTSDVCDPKTGQCGYTGLPDGTVCDPMAATGCKPVECKAQACVSATPPNCNDGNGCTLDSCTEKACAPGEAGCTPKAVCVHQAAAGSCDADSSVCTVGDACSGGACVAGSANSCNDNNPCTDDSCDKKAACSNVANTASCSDGDPCTSEQCAAGKCVATAIPCDPCLALGGTVTTIGTSVRVCSGKIGESKIKDYKIYGGWKPCTIPDMVALTKAGDHHSQPAWTNTPCTTNNQSGHMIYKYNSGWGALDLNSTDSYSCSSDYCCGYGPSQLLVCKP